MTNAGNRLYLGMGAVAVGAYFLFPGAGSAVWDIIALSVPVAILVGIRRYLPPRRLPWYLLAAGLGLYAAGDLLWLATGARSALGVSDAVYAFGYPVIALGCLFMAKGDRRSSLLAMIDALVGACGAAVIVWDLVLSKSIPGSGPSLTSVTNAAYPVLDILIVTLLIRLAMAERMHEPAFWLLAGGFALLLASDLGYAWLQRSNADPSSPLLDLGWLLSYLVIGGAALHPSMARLTQRRAPDAKLSPVRVLWLGVPLFAVPILILFWRRDRPIDLAVQGVAALAIAALIMARIVLSARDQERAHREARRAEIEYRTVFAGSPAAVLKVADGGEILDANPAADRLFGYSGGLVGRSIAEILFDDAEDGPMIVESVGALAAGPADASATWDVRVRRGDGSSFWSSMNTSIVKDPHGDISFGITTVEDITKQREEEEYLRFRALHDPLTGLPNRDLLTESLQRSLARVRRTGARVAVLFLDLDGFKDVNDRLGHAAGDDVLRALAQRLEAAARGGDIVARLGGDEFVIVVEDVRSVDQAEAAAERFLEEVHRPVVLGGGRATLQASIGLVVAGDPGDTVDEILRRADSAMYEAKRSGRGRWRRFEGQVVAGDPA